MTEIGDKRKELENNINNCRFCKMDIEQKMWTHQEVMQTNLEGFNLGVEMARKEIISRETKMECLSCGISLHREIMDKKIHIHLCRDCRIKELDKFIGEKTE